MKGPYTVPVLCVSVPVGDCLHLRASVVRFWSADRVVGWERMGRGWARQSEQRGLDSIEVERWCFGCDDK